MSLSSQWDNEAYVSVHLVQEMLIQAGLPKRIGFTGCWHPEFKIKVPKIEGSGYTEKKVDFLIEDHRRYVNFLIEVKSAKQRINDAARFQLVDKYLYRSKVKFGILIDPFSMEIYEYGQSKPKATFEIENPNHIEPIATFFKSFLEKVKMRTIAIKEIHKIHKIWSGVEKNVLGIVPMMTDGTNLNKNITLLVKNNFKDIPFLPEIKRTTYVGQALHKRIPLSLFAEQQTQAAGVARQMINLTNQLVERIIFLETQ